MHEHYRTSRYQSAAAAASASGMDSCTAAAAGDPADAAVRLLFLLDITGSMSQELEACKGAMHDMVSLCSSELQVYADAGQISFAVITFTESDMDGCFTSLFESTSPTAAQAYMDSIKLCTPPEHGHPQMVNASGDDGPENQKAALVRTTDLDPSVPTIAFLITDDLPHLALANAGDSREGRHSHGRRRLRVSATAMHELEYLAARYPSLSASDAQDFFKTFRNTTLAHFGTNLILNCVVYNSAGMDAQHPCAVQLLYGNLSQQTGGMLMQPESRDAACLAAGLISVVKALMGRLTGEPLQQEQGDGVQGELQGFRLIDLSGLTPDRSSEEEPAGVACYGDTHALFNIAMERIEAVCGKKWTKRGRGMSAPAEQLQFVWRAAHYLSLCAKPTPTEAPAAADLARAKHEELSKLLQLQQVVLAALPEGAKVHFSISEQDVRWMGEEVAAWAAAGGGAGGDVAVSAISLASVGEALEEDAVLEDWLHSVMKLLLGFPVQVQLPLDADGRPDFMDSWSAVLLRMGVDAISAAEFMQLISDKPSARGLTDKHEYNAFLVMPDPADKLATMVFRIASQTQALDYITSESMGSNRGFLPNLHVGITAASLTRLLAQPSALTEFQWTQVQQLAHGLCVRRTNAAKAATKQLLSGQANPEDNISKLLLAVLRLYRSSEAGVAGLAEGGAAAAATTAAADATCSVQQLQAALGLVLHEWLASLMQRHYGKQIPENDTRYLQSVLTYIPVDGVLDSTAGPPDVGSGDAGCGAGFDPLTHVSPLEKLDPNNLKAGGEVAQGIRPDWQAAVLQRLPGAHAGTPAHPVLEQFLLGAGRFLALLLPLGSVAGAAAQSAVKSSIQPDGNHSSDSDKALGSLLEQLPGAAAALDSCWPDWKQAAVEALLLRFRTARYTLLQPQEQPASAAVPATATDGVASVAVAKAQWVPAVVGNCLALAVGRLQEALSAQLRGYKRARIEHAKQQLVHAVASLLQQHVQDTEKACEALQQLILQLPAGHSASPAARSAAHVAASSAGPAGAAALGPVATLLNVTFTLQRTDVPAVLEALGASLQPAQEQQQVQDARQLQEQSGVHGVAAVEAGTVTPDMLRVLVLGSWCTQGAQALRRCQLVQQLCWLFGATCQDVRDALSAREECNRTAGSNRHGHSASMRHPGPDGWTEAYATARLAAVARKAKRARIRTQAVLKAMERYTAIAAWARKVAAGNVGKAAAVDAVLAQVMDAHQHQHVLSQLQTILGKEMT